MKKVENRGITLIALVVTIIVLIILAGVSISLILGQDGVVQKAKQGRDSYEDAARIENEQLANVDAFAMTVQEMTPSTSTVTGEITNMADGELEISATVNLEGNIDLAKTKYVFTTGSNPLGTNDESLYKDGNVGQASGSVKATKKVGTYYLHVLTTSTNGAKKEIISEETATSQGKKDFDYTGSVQDIILTPGNYKLEVWGAQGGDSTVHGNIGGKGAYAYGNLTVMNTTQHFIYVGGKGSSVQSSAQNSTTMGGWNGGGGITKAEMSGYSRDSNHWATGGGGTDICTVQSPMSEDSYGRYVRTAESYNSRIIVAGGGAGNESIGVFEAGSSSNYCGSQTKAGDMDAYNYGSHWNGGLGYGASASFGPTNHEGYSGAGGGYYGGGHSLISSEGKAGGGSSYVGSLENSKMYVASESFPSPTGTNETGHSGNGYARITALD